MRIKIIPSSPKSNYIPREAELRPAQHQIKPPLNRPFTRLPPIKIVDWGIVNCYAIPIRHVTPADGIVIGSYIHHPSDNLSLLPGQLQQIRKEMTSEGMKGDPRLSAVLTGISLPAPTERIEKLEMIAGILRANGIDVEVDNYHNDLFVPELETRRIEFDIQQGVVAIRSYYRFGTH